MLNALYVINNGSVGIGSSSPGYTLDVNGTIRFGGFTGADSDQWPNVVWYRDTGNNWDEGLIRGSTARGVFGRAHFGIHFNDQRSFAFHTSGWDTEMEIKGDGTIYMKGPLGINTTAPATTFNINQGAGGANGTFVVRIGGTNNYASLELGIFGDYDGMITSYGNDLRYYAGHWRTIGSTSSEDHKHMWFTSKAGSSDWSTAKMTLNHDGNLGVGVTSPGYKVEVAGAVKAGTAGNSSANIRAIALVSAGTATTQAAIGFQQMTTEGDTFIFADYEPYAEYNFFHENSGDRFMVNSGGSTNSLETNTFYNASGNARTGYAKWIMEQNSGNMYVGGSVGIGTSSTTYKLRVQGQIYASDDIIAYSDARAKENVVTLDNALNKVTNLRGVYYTRKDDETKKKNVGVIAQEILEVVPELVSYSEQSDEYAVKYQNITALLIEAIKELKADNDDLRSLITELQNK
jgi:hypothetical protein